MSKDQRRVNFIPWIHKIITITIFIISFFTSLFRTIYYNINYTIIDFILYFLVFSSFIYFIIISIKSELTDSQTGRINDSAFVLYCIHLLIKKRLCNYTAIFMNIKNYKLINRLAGSIGGDKGLEIYGKTINNYLVKGEKLARLGGDNFAVLIRKERLEDFLKFISEISINLEVNGIIHQYKINTRCGLYSLKETDGVGSVLNYSAIALNFARAKSKDFVWYDEKMADQMYKEKEISSNFKEALINNEFKVYYQPKVNIFTNTLHGCEALVRWEKNGKLLMPNEFIPALENNGFIVDLDHYVLEQVCSDIIRWKKNGFNCVKVSTNFSKLNLQDADFSTKILKTINSYAIDKSLIEIELTESSNYIDYNSLIKFLEIMKQNNISTAIDDFGVGFSSLELLKNINVNVVKIDKRFIDNIEINDGNNNNFILVKNILNTCDELKKEVVCEGVENSSQQKILKELNCKTIQGYLYDKPLSCDNFEKRLLQPCYVD